MSHFILTVNGILSSVYISRHLICQGIGNLMQVIYCPVVCNTAWVCENFPCSWPDIVFLGKPSEGDTVTCNVILSLS